MTITEEAPTPTRVFEVAEKFVNTVIKDGVTLEDNMVDIRGILSVHEYVKAIIQEEEATATKDKKRNIF